MAGDLTWEVSYNSYDLRLLIYLRVDLGSSVNKFKVSSFFFCYLERLDCFK